MSVRSWLRVVFLLTPCVSACTTSVEERLREQNEDGIFLFERGQYETAAQTFSAALKQAPEQPQLYYNLGQCHARLNQPAKAIEAFEACLRRAPNHPECRFALASLRMKEGMPDEAKRMIDEWIRSEPRLADAYALDGWYWHQVGDLPRAQSRLQQALELGPQNSLALTELGRVYEDLHRPERSLILYERSLRANPRQSYLVSRINRLRKEGVGPPLLDDLAPEDD